MALRRDFYCLLLLFISSLAAAQNRNASFYFGTLMGYNTVEDRMLPTVDLSGIIGFSPFFSCISDDKTGKLLFYTNGSSVFGANHQLMQDGVLSTGTSWDVLIVPDPASTSLYYIFYVHDNTLFYAKVDLSNGGRVISKEIPLMNNVTKAITAVSYIHKSGWWLITHSLTGNAYYAFLIEAQGINTTPVVSNAGNTIVANESFRILMSSHKGDQIMVARGGDQSVPIGDRKIELVDFNKKCGTVTNARTLIKDFGKFIMRGVFSPDDSKIFVSRENSIVQYSGTGYKDSVTIASAVNEGFMFTGSDNVIYVVGLGSDIYRITQPDALYPACKYALWRPIQLPSFSVVLADPRQIMDRSSAGLSDKINFTFDYACTRFKAEFTATNDQFYDSVRWNFGDAASPDNISTSRNASHIYNADGNYKVTLTAYNCGFTDTVEQTLKVRDRLNPKLGNDTSVCFKDSLLLIARITADSYLWSNGSTRNAIYTADPGAYWVQVTLGDCKNRDTIVVDQYTDIWTALGDEYFICSDTRELVKLDAGEGFQNYKWLPTGDTTQWINVADLGDYFVIVKDFRGCKGNDGTKVKRRCPVKVYFPNAFTPNGDGLNDYYEPFGKDVTAFEMTIYNSWGQLVFKTGSIDIAWDGTFGGKPAPLGVYLYKASYSGYRNKNIVSFETSGNLTLIR